MQKKKFILSPRELQELTRRTIGHYEFNSESYQIGAVDHDVSQNYKALLDSIESEIPFKNYRLWVWTRKRFAIF